MAGRRQHACVVCREETALSCSVCRDHYCSKKCSKTRYHGNDCVPPLFKAYAKFFNVVHNSNIIHLFGLMDLSTALVAGVSAAEALSAAGAVSDEERKKVLVDLLKEMIENPDVKNKTLDILFEEPLEALLKKLTEHRDDRKKNTQINMDILVQLYILCRGSPDGKSPRKSREGRVRIGLNGFRPADAHQRGYFSPTSEIPQGTLDPLAEHVMLKYPILHHWGERYICFFPDGSRIITSNTVAAKEAIIGYIERTLPPSSSDAKTLFERYLKDPNAWRLTKIRECNCDECKDSAPAIL